jgi:hypothetical protein
MVANAVHRVQRGKRVLENHLDLRRICPRPPWRRGPTVEPHLSGIGCDDLGQQTSDRRLPGATFTDQRGDLSGVEAYRDALDRVNSGPAGKEAAALLHPEGLGERAPLKH